METHSEVSFEMKYKKIRQGQKQACDSWRNKNREKYNELTRNYYHQRKKDPAFMENIRQRERANYRRRKEKQKQEDEAKEEKATI